MRKTAFDLLIERQEQRKIEFLTSGRMPWSREEWRWNEEWEKEAIRKREAIRKAKGEA